MVLQHHERVDGNGYPNGLTGKIICLGARIFAVADAFDAMTSDRPYRKALGREQAIEIIKQESGKQFDPDIVKAFLKVIEKETIGGQH
jgi:HD-GYP domain-containing protein (c-di-GMP phosphodiesterase class II)